MHLAFVLYKYFPFGGLQRDFLRIAEACAKERHEITVYTKSWKGDAPKDWQIKIPSKVIGFNRSTQNEHFSHWVFEDLANHRVDRLIGFNKMPSLDYYYAADPCYAEKAHELRGRWYRYSRRYRHFAQYEDAVFSPKVSTKILMISASQKKVYQHYYQTPDERLFMLPPGVSRDRIAPPNAADIRREFREEFGLKPHDHLLLMVGSGFKTKGLDRSIKALASLPKDLLVQTKLIAIGEDDPKPFPALSRSLGVQEHVLIMKGRSDIQRFMLGADVLLHPAYQENTGTVILEALANGLPVLATDICGYSPYICESKAGMVLKSPFEQSQMNQRLLDLLSNPVLLEEMSVSGVNYAKHADIYSMPEKAAQIILDQS